MFEVTVYWKDKSISSLTFKSADIYNATPFNGVVSYTSESGAVYTFVIDQVRCIYRMPLLDVSTSEGS